MSSKLDDILLQNDLNGLSNWCDRNILCFNVKKCYQMIFHQINSPTNLNEKLCTRKEYVYLLNVWYYKIILYLKDYTACSRVPIRNIHLVLSFNLSFFHSCIFYIFIPSKMSSFPFSSWYSVQNSFICIHPFSYFVFFQCSPFLE